MENKKLISDIIGTDDRDVLEFIGNIYKESKYLADFVTTIEKLDAGISSKQAEELYTLLQDRYVPKAEAVKDQVGKILKDHAGISDSVVTDFILQHLQNAGTFEEFQHKLDDMGSGLPKDIIFKIYHIAKLNTEKDIRQDHVPELPNSNIKFKTDNDKMEGKDLMPILHKIYRGQVRKITSFGCFIQIMGTQKRNCDGLLHISQMSKNRIRHPSDILKIGEWVYIQVIKVQADGRVSLSMKNIDQATGKLEHGHEYGPNLSQRGRSNTRDNLDMNAKVKRRKLTSPERWEIRQLIASGAASIEDYPELEDPTNGLQHNGNSTTNLQEEDEMEAVDIEMNMDGKPKFLKNENVTEAKKYEAPKLVKVPRGSINRAAMRGSNTMQLHREEKLQKRKEIEQQIRKKRSMDDPSKDKIEVKEEIEHLKKQLVLTAWERNRLREKIEYGKRTKMPIDAQRRSLPVYKMRDELLAAIRQNQFLVIVGETGSGKTTQITQYLDEDGFSTKGIIGCTQPRRVAAVSVAKRVAEEVGCKVGQDVGYTIRFEDETSPKTRIKYMTDGMLQREAIADPTMSRYSVIMLDEAHERTVATDVLFGLLKKAVEQRPDLKVIITSATLDAEKFSEYFNDCPIIKVPGKTYPVEVLYAQTPQMDYIESALDAVVNIHVNEGPGDILVFLTGQEEIDTCCEILYERVKKLEGVIGELIILPVYSALPSENQSKIFEPTPKGCRKVVFATNIAETSITIDGIYYVIDPGFTKINTFNPRVGMEQLLVTPISQAQANQRKGRAGRTGPGKCYRLYTESVFYNELLANSIPEIQRKDLSHTILMLKAMGITDLMNFEFMDPPPRNFMLKALEELYHLGAIDDDGYLTELGHLMSQFPMEPTLAKTLLQSVSDNCSEEIITIISMLSVANVFYRPRDRQQEADGKKSKFHHLYGDHLTLLNVYDRWSNAGFSEQYCELNFLQYRHLKKVKEIIKQIKMIFGKLQLPVRSCHGDPDCIRKTLVSGFFMNAAKRDSRAGGYKTIQQSSNHNGTVAGIHPSSALCGKEYEYVIYHALVLTSREYMSQVTAINPEWLVQVAPHYYKISDSDSLAKKRARIEPLYNKFAKDQNSWRLSSIRQSRERVLGIKR